MSIAGQGVSYDKCYSSLARTGPRQGRVKWTWRPRVTRGSREHDLRAAHTATRRGPKRTYALSRGEQLTVKRPSFTTLRTPPLPFSAHPRTADFSGSTARVRISPDCRSVVHAPSASAICSRIQTRTDVAFSARARSCPLRYPRDAVRNVQSIHLGVVFVTDTTLVDELLLLLLLIYCVIHADAAFRAFPRSPARFRLATRHIEVQFSRVRVAASELSEQSGRWRQLV